ncbi:MAG: type II toxin-antitoxin system RelE/ParE family toxin [Giesbergeria sp.]
MTRGHPKKLPAVFFRSDIGTEPVRDWLVGPDLTDADRRVIGVDIATVEFGWPIGMPTCRAMGRGLFEVRSHLPQGRIARVLFSVHEGRMVLLHGFIKKASKTPADDLTIAQSRKKDIER